MASPLYSPGEFALMSGAGTGLPARPDFSVVGNITPQNINLLVVNHSVAVGTKLTNSGTGVIAPSAAI
jgi:hypothetical protein